MTEYSKDKVADDPEINPLADMIDQAMDQSSS